MRRRRVRQKVREAAAKTGATIAPLDLGAPDAMLDPDVNECHLFHGSTAIDVIIHDGLCEKYGAQVRAQRGSTANPIVYARLLCAPQTAPLLPVVSGRAGRKGLCAVLWRRLQQGEQLLPL